MVTEGDILKNCLITNLENNIWNPKSGKKTKLSNPTCWKKFLYLLLEALAILIFLKSRKKEIVWNFEGEEFETLILNAKGEWI